MTLVRTASWYVDLRRQPHRYPGPAPDAPGLLIGGRYQRHHRTGGDDPELEGRTALLAVGSNANPAVVHTKLTAAAVDSTVVFRRCRVARLSVGHSAHVSAAGYLPAAPFRSEGSTVLWVLLLTTAQLVALDATEPNYRRVRLDPREHPVALPGRPYATSMQPQVYVSLHGVLVGADGRPLRLGSQQRAREAFLLRLPPQPDRLRVLTSQL